MIETPVGARRPDCEGEPVAVVRMEPERSYCGVGELLQKHLDGAGEEPWQAIRAKIDYTYEALDRALGPLDAARSFGPEIRRRLEQGQKLLFKPNLVSPLCIDPQTYAPTAANQKCTQWPFVAALMRWFHDRLGARYTDMCLGEAATGITWTAARLSLLTEESFTPEAVIEGRTASCIGGWGFYFVRKYLAQAGSPAADDDPMSGFAESVQGSYVPPGKADKRLLVYDLNHVEGERGRSIQVSDGENFKSITLHKAIVGGDPRDPVDRANYPGCILINVPKLKVHNIALFTNAIKNLGIGLFPMHCKSDSGDGWQYAVPNGSVPGMKALIPHYVWTAEIDPATHVPRKTADGSPVVRQTAGLDGTMVDLIKAVVEQGVFTLHVVDAVETANLDHGSVTSFPNVRVREGLAVAGLDPVATDLFCARYMFCNVGIEEAKTVGLDDGHGGNFPQRVPIPTREGPNIVSHSGYDCPLARSATFAHAQRRGLGTQRYYVVGRDVTSDTPLVSVEGHLGSVSADAFQDIFTQTLYYDALQLPWDLQRTCLNYLHAVDELSGSQLEKQLLADYTDTSHDSFSYNETGRDGSMDSLLQLAGEMLALHGLEEHGDLHGQFELFAPVLKLSNPAYNPLGSALLRPTVRNSVLLVAKMLSELPLELPDSLQPSLVFGKGKWPSYQTAAFVALGVQLYGNEFPFKVSYPGLYVVALYYADRSQRKGEYAGTSRRQPAPEGAQRYIADVTQGRAEPLKFTFYVPPGYGAPTGTPLPNVEETTDPERVFTACFDGGKETWPVCRLEPSKRQTSSEKSAGAWAPARPAV